jgi:hypothetical protein
MTICEECKEHEMFCKCGEDELPASLVGRGVIKPPCYVNIWPR